jgi:hypothetical protein
MPALTGAFSDRATASEDAFLTQVGQGLTVKDALDDIVLLWGIQRAALAPPYLQKRAVHDLNAALQMIWALAKNSDYFNRETITLTFATNVSQAVLPGNVLTVLGPARLAIGSVPIRPVSSRAQFDAFGPVYLGQLSYAVSNGPPVAFFIEKLNIALPDDVQNIMHVVPTPSSSTDILLDVSVQSPRYKWSDYVLATPVQMPQLYADSVLLPFCRYKAMTSHFLANPDDRPSLVADYQTALKLIGAIDPSMKEVQFAERASDRAAA